MGEIYSRGLLLAMALGLAGCGTGANQLQPMEAPLTMVGGDPVTKTLYAPIDFVSGAAKPPPSGQIKQVDVNSTLRAALVLNISGANNKDICKKDDFTTPEAHHGCLISWLEHLPDSLEPPPEYQRTYSVKMQIRNSVVGQLMEASQSNCQSYVASLRTNQSSRRFQADALSILTTGVATTVKHAYTAKTWAALTGVTTGIGSAYDQDFFAHQSIEVLVRYIEKERDDRWGDLSKKLSLPYADWPLGVAEAEVLRFHAECSLDHALGHVAAVIEQRDSDRIHMQSLAAGLSKIHASPDEVAAALTAYIKTLYAPSGSDGGQGVGTAGPNSKPSSLAAGTTGASDPDLEVMRVRAMDCAKTLLTGLNEKNAVVADLLLPGDRTKLKDEKCSGGTASATWSQALVAHASTQMAEVISKNERGKDATTGKDVKESVWINALIPKADAELVALGETVDKIVDAYSQRRMQFRAIAAGHQPAKDKLNDLTALASSSAPTSTNFPDLPTDPALASAHRILEAMSNAPEGTYTSAEVGAIGIETLNQYAATHSQ